MRMCGFVILREKKYLQTVSAWESMVRDYQTKIGALEFDKRELEKALQAMEKNMAEFECHCNRLQEEYAFVRETAKRLKEMNDGLWEMKDPTMKGE